jgi:hypothetical protein
VISKSGGDNAAGGANRRCKGCVSGAIPPRRPIGYTFALYLRDWRG